MNVVFLDQEKYYYLKCMLCDYCLLRQIIKKQYEHVELYPTDVRTIRNMYNQYPMYGYSAPEVERFIKYNQINIKAIVGNVVDKRDNVDVYQQIYTFGHDNPDKDFFERLKQRFDMINSEIIKSLNKYYNFDNDHLVFSTMDIPEYFRENYNKSMSYSRFDREEFKKSKLYTSYITQDYSLAYAIDTYDIKMNQDFWDKYTMQEYQEIIAGIVASNQTEGQLAGVDKLRYY